MWRQAGWRKSPGRDAAAQLTPEERMKKADAAEQEKDELGCEAEKKS